jgi:ribonuclease Z
MNTSISRAFTRIARFTLALLALSLAGAALAQAPGPAQELTTLRAPVDDDDFRVTLLGTGSPPPIMRRFGPAILVEAGGQLLVFDAGRGITQRLMQVPLRLGLADKVFITHLHSDHILGLPDLWLTGWLESAYAQRKGPLRVWGPAGTRMLTDNLTRAFDWDLQTRAKDQNLDPANAVFVTTEIAEGTVYESGGVKVTAFAVDHGPLIQPAFGYRVDYGGRAVVMSGDTRFSENLIKFAQGADLLIHQVAAAKEELLRNPVYKVVLDHHTKPEEAGVVFTRVAPKLAVYSHLVLLGAPGIAPVTEDEVLAMTRKTYAGPLLMGEDLTRFRIGKGGVAVTRP